MRPLDAIKLVAGREISMRGKDKSFVYSTLITLGVIVIVILLNLATSGDESYTVGYVGEEARTVAEFVESSSTRIDVEIELETFDDLDAAETALSEGELDGVVTADSLVFNENAPGQLEALLTGVIDLPGSAVLTLLNVLLWFVLGYIFYGCLFAVAGAIAARQEDLQSTTMPLSMMLLASLFGAIFVANNPESIIGFIGTLVPLTAPLIVPVRIATGTSPSGRSSRRFSSRSALSWYSFA